MIAFVAALVVLPFFAQSALATCARTYTVQAGDICDGISAAHNVSTYQLAVTNSGTIDASCSNLMPGQTLCLGNVGEDCTTTHVVASGETCDAITQAAGINKAMLYGNNPQINADCTNIYIGEVLCIAGQIQVPAAPPAGNAPTTANPPSGAAPPYSQSTPSPSPLPASSSGDDNLPYCDEL
jgi:LysM repeat protein